MMMNQKSLAQMRADIITNIKSILNDNTLVNQPLSDVKSIQFGYSTTVSNLKLPAVWVLPNMHVPQMEGANRLMHDFTYEFVALVSGNDPQKGHEAAQDLAARVYDVIMADRSLNGVVFDVFPLRIDPSFTINASNSSTQTYWSAIQIAFRIIL